MRGPGRATFNVLAIAMAIASVAIRAATIAPANPRDLEGIWTFATMTPLERPRELAAKAVLTPAEAADYERQIIERQRTTNATAGPDWWDPGTRVLTNRRTSLIVEPSDGRAVSLVHELTHQFEFEMIPLSSGVPAWVHEALSDHETGTWTPSDLLRVRDAAAAGVMPTVAGGAPLDRLWGHAVLDFVAAEYGTQGMRRYLTALRSSSPPSDSVLALFGVTASDFDRAFQTYVRTRFNDR